MQDAAGFSAEQQLMMMYGNSNEQLLGLLASEGSGDATAAAAAAGPSRSNAYPGTSATPSLSDGAPMAAAAAAATAAAANSAAYAAAHHSLSAPLFMFGSNASQMDPRMQQLSAAQARAGREDQMDQAELLMALQAMADSSEPLPRINSIATASAALGGGEASPTTGAEHTSCSLPLMQLRLDHTASMPQPPESPAGSMGGAPCKSAPLGGLRAAGGPFQGMNGTQRSLGTSAAAAAFQQQQSGMPRSASRLKWLIQELQQELDSCGPSELEALNNDELGTLLCAALAPAKAEAVAGCAGAALASAQGRRAAAAAMSDVYMQDAGPASFLGAGHAGMAMGAHSFQSYGGAPGHLQQPELALQVQKVQVAQLQHQVQQLQAQLQVTKDSGVNGKQLCPAPLPAPARTVSAAAGFTGLRGSAEMLPVYSQASMPSFSSIKEEGSMSGLLQQRAALGGMLSGPNSQPQPGMHMQAAAAAAGVPEGSSSASLLPKRPGTPANVAPGWGPSAQSGMPSSGAMEQMLRQQQMQMQQLQQQASAGMQMPTPMSGDSSAVMQFMSLQSQLKMVEDEMMLLVAQQSNFTR
jgi:hypothetical protein